ncbi:methyltransferase C-terminal domain-containing protein [Geodermatophilus sp. CPCC 205761]
MVLDLGLQPACDDFPLPDDPPVMAHPLRLWACDRCGLVQLPDRSPAPREPRAVEPAALAAHARQSVAWVLERGLVSPGSTVREFGSPHGGSWAGPLADRGLRAVEDDDRPAETVVDVFGLMHEEDQRAGLHRRVAALAPGGLLVLVFPPLETVVSQGQWYAVRHGHHAYPSTAVAARQLAECGLAVVASSLHHLYGGTRLLAARRGALGGEPVRQVPDVSRAALSALAGGVRAGVAALRGHLEGQAAAGREVLGYGAASRAVPLLIAAGVGPDLLPGIADASPAKHGRLVPGTGIPVISPAELAAARPDEVLLFLPDLLEEVRAGIPGVERSGGRWRPVGSLLRASSAPLDGSMPRTER